MNVIMFPTMFFILIGIIAFIILLIKLLNKNPKFAAILILVPVVLIALFVLMRFVDMPVRRTAYNDTYQEARPVWETYQYSGNTSPIWSEGIENEFEADIYPSKISAARSLGRQIKRPVKLLWGEQKIPNIIFILRDENDPELIDEFAKIVCLEYPEIPCEIKNGFSLASKPDLPDEVLMGLKIVDTKETAPWQISSFEPGIAGKGRVEATVVVKNGHSTISEQFIEKPWVENFSQFTNLQSNKQYIVARSNESCLTPSEANRQAMNDAFRQIEPMFANSSLSSVKLTSRNILETGLIVDKFVQSFQGSAGYIWRQAILLDVSPDKMNRLADNIAVISRIRRAGLFRTILSVAGLFVLITIVYIFLNTATKGYYTWSLRIVGIILAAIFLFFILKIRL